MHCPIATDPPAPPAARSLKAPDTAQPPSAAQSCLPLPLRITSPIVSRHIPKHQPTPPKASQTLPPPPASHTHPFFFLMIRRPPRSTPAASETTAPPGPPPHPRPNPRQTTK